MSIWYAFLNALGIRMFEMDFMKNALLAVLLLGPLFGLLSTMIVTGKMSFFSDALGHSGFTGIAIGVLCGAVQPIYFAVGLSVLFALLFSFVRSRTSQSADTIIGVFSSTAVALGIFIVTLGGRSFTKFNRYLIGDILSVSPQEIGLLALVLLVAAPHLWHRAEQLMYPRKYEQLVDQWAQTYNLDPLLVDAFIRTESGFDPAATSSVDARGLMQMTEETFLWLRSKIAADEDLAFADLYDPDTSIRFGCCYLHLCLERYNGDVATAAAAYHSGWGTVDNLLRMEEHSADGQTLQGFPYSQMNHYVNKITSCYGAYQRIYAGN